MYHSLTYQQISKRRARILVVIVAVIAIVLGVFMLYNTISYNMREQSAQSIKNTIINTAQQAAAIEGAYPATLSYLEQNYGLTINHEEFVVHYEVFASNILPSVEVVPR